MYGVFWVPSHSMWLVSSYSTLSSPAPLKAHGWEKKKKSSLKPFTFQLIQSSLSLHSHILTIYNPTFLEKGESCVAKRASPTRLYTSVYTNPTQRIAAHLYTAYHFEFRALCLILPILLSA